MSDLPALFLPVSGPASPGDTILDICDGMEQTSINARVKMLQKKNLAMFKPKLGGIQRERDRTAQKDAKTDKAQQFLLKIQSYAVTYSQDLLVMQDVFRYIDGYAMTDGSFETQMCVASVGMCRYCEHLGLIEGTEASLFYHSVGVYYAYLDIEKEVSKLVATPIAANIYDDELKGQNRRAIFNNVGLGELFVGYFARLKEFSDAVQNKEWRAALSALSNFWPEVSALLIGGIIPVLSTLPAEWAMANNILGRLNSAFRVSPTIDPKWLTIGYANRQKWADNAVGIVQAGNTFANIINDASGFFTDFTWEKTWRVATGAGVASTTPGVGQTDLERHLTNLWRFDTALGPQGKILATMGISLARAFVKAAQFEKSSMRTFVELNSRKDARQWADELTTATELSKLPALTESVKAARKQRISTILQDFVKRHRLLKRALAKKPMIAEREKRELAAMVYKAAFNTRIALYATGLSVVKRFVTLNITTLLQNLDSTIVQFKNMEAKFTDPELETARRVVREKYAKEARDRLARGEPDPPDSEAEEGEDEMDKLYEAADLEAATRAEQAETAAVVDDREKAAAAAQAEADAEAEKDDSDDDDEL